MSRSYKKPYRGPCAGHMRQWKKAANKIIRTIKDLRNGRYYKRFLDIWGSPSDGPKKFHPEDKKLTRK